jgi:hypothetical protein
VPSTDEYDGQKLFTKRNGKRLVTPLVEDAFDDSNRSPRGEALL